jgi:hypothetical protein
MPGRSCVALTLLMILCDPGQTGVKSSVGCYQFSEIPVGLERSRIQNDSRHAGENFMPSAKLQYKGAESVGSIVALLGFLGALFRGAGHDLFDFIGIAGQALTEKFVAGIGDQHIVFDAHAEIFFRNIDARLHGD